MEQFLVFETFADKEQALRTAALLENRDIPVAIEENLPALDSNFIGQQFSDQYALRIPGNCFTAAREILMATTVINLEEVDRGYMLLSFSNEELLEVMSDTDAWGIYNYKLAEALLRQRNVAVPVKEIALAQQEKQAEKAMPESFSIFWIVLGYLSAIGGSFVYAYYIGGNFTIIVLPGLLGVLIGWNLAFNKKTLQDGSRVPAFKPVIRMHGTIIFWLSLLLFILRIVIFFF
jgi:hypothetical protein